MRIRQLFFALGLPLMSAAAQTSGPGSTPALPSDVYTPVYGVTAGIAIPIGHLADDHAAGYTLGGLVEYSVTGQPYALRGELTYQRFALKSNRTDPALTNVNLTSLGATVVYRMQNTPTNTFLTGGIAVYHGTGYGTRPGFNGGAGLEIPLQGFSATAESRLHLMLADGRPVITLPLTVGIRF